MIPLDLFIKKYNMSKVQIQTEIDSKALLAGAAQLKIKELEAFVRELNGTLIRKKAQDKGHQEKILIGQINRTVLSKKKNERYQELSEKLRAEAVSETERQEFLQLVAEEEELRNNRVQLLIELSQLRNIPLSRQMEELGLTPPGRG